MTVRMTIPQSRRQAVEVDGREIYLTKSELVIVEYLLLRRPYLVSRNQLIEAVWPNPDLEPDEADGTIGVHLHRIRRKGVPIVRVGMRGCTI